MVGGLEGYVHTLTHSHTPTDTHTYILVQVKRIPVILLLVDCRSSTPHAPYTHIPTHALPLTKLEPQVWILFITQLPPRRPTSLSRAHSLSAFHFLSLFLLFPPPLTKLGDTNGHVAVFLSHGVFFQSPVDCQNTHTHTHTLSLSLSLLFPPL